MTATPAYLGDARLGDRIRFALPADTHGGTTVHEGVIWAYDRDQHAVGHPLIAFRIGGNVARLFRCRPDLHIDLIARRLEETR